MPRVVIIDHFSQAPGEKGNNRFIYLAGLLVQNGYDVEVITSNFSHIQKKKRELSPRTLADLPFAYTMLHEPPYPRNVCVKRILSHMDFGHNLKEYLFCSEFRKPDAIYVAIPSLDAANAARQYCKREQIPFLVDIQDLWPEAFKLALKIPVLNSILFEPMHRRARAIYRSADALVSVSQTYLEKCTCGAKKYGEHKVFLGTDLSRFDMTSAHNAISKPEDEIWIVYVGTLGRSYNISIVINALDRIVREEQVNYDSCVFKVLGDGPDEDRFRAYAAEKQVRVDFLGRRSYGDMIAYLKKSDIAVNPIVKGAAQSIINKHADYAAAGLPVVNTQENVEYRSLLDAYECGINCPVEDVDAVAQALKKLIDDTLLRKRMSANSRRMAEEMFNRSRTYTQIVEMLADCVYNRNKTGA